MSFSIFAVRSKQSTSTIYRYWKWTLKMTYAKMSIRSTTTTTTVKAMRKRRTDGTAMWTFLVVVLVAFLLCASTFVAFQPSSVLYHRGRSWRPSVGMTRPMPIWLMVIKDETGTLSADTASPPKTAFQQVTIEYCTGCRWMLKSFWLAQELLSTFGKDALDAVTVVPSFDTKGKFVMQLHSTMSSSPGAKTKKLLLWDRQEQGGFPVTKEFKQTLRDAINPDLYLGHSDTETRQRQSAQEGETTREELDTTKSEMVAAASSEEDSSSVAKESHFELPFAPPSPSITIHYCTGCQWLLRAAYVGQELLTTFGEGEIKSVTLVPSKPPDKGGRFSIELDDTEIFDRKTEGRFPEPKEIKQMIRDRIAPNKDLGHSDTAAAAATEQKEQSASEDDDEDDDQAEEARKYFGVM